MEIKHTTSDTKGEFAAIIDGSAKAKITYSKLGNIQIIADHTEVADELRGQNVGKKLVEHLVEFARSHNLRVIPLCPFAKSVIDRNKNLQDVLKKR